MHTSVYTVHIVVCVYDARYKGFGNVDDIKVLFVFMEKPMKKFGRMVYHSHFSWHIKHPVNTLTYSP